MELNLTETPPTDTPHTSKKAKANHAAYTTGSSSNTKDERAAPKQTDHQNPIPPLQDKQTNDDEQQKDIPPYLDPAEIAADYDDWLKDQEELDNL